MIIILSRDLGSSPSSAKFSSLDLPEFPSVKWGAEGLNEIKDVAEASKVNDSLCLSLHTLLGGAGALSPHSVRSFFFFF